MNSIMDATALASTFLSRLAGGMLLAPLMLFSPVGWLVVTVGAVCGIRALKFRYQPEWRWLLVLWPLVTSTVATGIGMAFEHPAGSDAGPPDVASQALDALIVVHLVGSVVVVFLARDFRLLIVPPLCLGTLFAGGCLFLSTMYVSGEWL